MAKLSYRLRRRPVFAAGDTILVPWPLPRSAEMFPASDFGGDLMRNLILILLLVLFFAFIYLLMSRIDRILDRLRKGNLRMEQQRPVLIGKYRTKMILSIDLRKNPFYDGNQKNHARIWKDPAL